MANFDLSHRIIMRNEGGYANVGTDAGGETYKGISRKWWPNWLGWPIIDQVKATREIKRNEEINDVYLKMYVKSFYKALWKSFNGDAIKDQAIANIMFDMFVLTGDDAVKIAQRIGNSLGIQLDVDGKLGKMTAAFLNQVNPERFYQLYYEAREQFHRRIAGGNAKTGAPNLVGWLNRLYTFQDYLKKKTVA